MQFWCSQILYDARALIYSENLANFGKTLIFSVYVVILIEVFATVSVAIGLGNLFCTYLIFEQWLNMYMFKQIPNTAGLIERMLGTASARIYHFWKYISALISAKGVRTKTVGAIFFLNTHFRWACFMHKKTNMWVFGFFIYYTRLFNFLKM